MSNDDKKVAWTFVGSLITVKLVTSVIILYFFPSWHTLLLVVVLSLTWFVLPVIYLSTESRGHYRLLKARARRRKLLRQEWDVEEHSHSNKV